MIELVTTGGYSYPNMTIGKQYKVISTEKYYTTIMDDHNELLEIGNWMKVDV